MRNIFIYITLFMCAGITSAQETFSQVYDFYDRTQSERFVSLVQHNNLLYTSSAGRCDSFTIDCANLLALDLEGNIDWLKPLRWLDIGSRSLELDADSLYLGGHDYLSDDKHLLYTSSTNGDSLHAYEILPTDTIYRYTTRGLRRFNDQSVIYGNARSVASDIPLGTAVFVNNSGNIDTTLVFDRGDIWNNVADMELDENGNLTVLIQLTESDTGQVAFEAVRLGIIKYDTDLNEIWSWYTDNTNLLTFGYISSLEILDDGTIIIIGDSSFPQYEEQIWAIDPVSGIIKWRHDLTNSLGTRINIYSLKKTNSNEILACGDIEEGPTINAKTGYFLKLSSDGDLIWERVILDRYNDIFGQDPAASFSDIEELGDGSLVVAGSQFVWYENIHGDTILDQDAWLVRTDSEGCINNDCGFISDITSSIETIFPRTFDNFILFPNPVNELLTIRLYQNSDDLIISSVEIYDGVGNKKYRDRWTKGLEEKNINTRQLGRGTFWVIARDKNNKVIGREPFMKF